MIFKYVGNSTLNCECYLHRPLHEKKLTRCYVLSQASAIFAWKATLVSGLHLNSSNWVQETIWAILKEMSACAWFIKSILCSCACLWRLCVIHRRPLPPTTPYSKARHGRRATAAAAAAAAVTTVVSSFFAFSYKNTEKLIKHKFCEIHL